MYAIQLAKIFCAHVTAVCGTAGIKACREMGADITIDYKSDTVYLSESYDVIIDYSSRFTFADARPHLTADGRYVDSSPSIPKVIGSSIANLFRKQKNLMLMTSANSDDLNFLSSLVQKNQLRVTVAKAYPLEASREAFVQQERGGTVGKIIVTRV